MSNPNNLKNPGIKRSYFPLPPPDEIERYTCVMLSIPDTEGYRVALFSTLYMLTQWFNWERDSGKRGKIVADIWKEVVDNMAWENACCGDDKPQRQRILQDGTYEISYDDGETWTPAPPELDPRENSIEFPPLPEPTGTMECASAENVVANLQAQLQNQIDDINLGVSIVGLVSATLAVVAIFMSGGTLAPLVTALCAATFGAGSAALSAAFTEGVWDEFKCILERNAASDGSYSNDAIQTIKQEIDDTYVGIVVTVLWSYMDMFGSIGVTNMGRTGTATGEDCGCSDEWCREFDFIASDGGWESEGTYVAAYYSGEGWGASVDLGSGNVDYIARSCGIYVDFGVSAFVTTMHVEWSIGGNIENIGYFLGDHNLYSFGAVIANPQGITINVSTSGIGVLIDRANPNSLSTRIIKVTLRGTGVNPFGSDNCE